jgi:cholesterol oxidase
MTPQTDYDYIIIGSGFGGSVAALRLAEKGYRVLILEKGRWFKTSDFPKRNWNIKKWLWVPLLRFFGFFKISFFRHITILSGVGVGGGSLVYANTLPLPEKEFFQAESWAHLADWETELSEHYQTAAKMMGITRNPRLETGDLALQEIATETGNGKLFSPTEVAVFFGEPDVEVPDPYFAGKGPARVGCNFCGGCMTGCRHNAKNSLDKNYLYLAKQSGARILAEAEVYDILPLEVKDGSRGYRIRWKSTSGLIKKRGEFQTSAIIFAGGVLGTVPLLLNLKKKSLPALSEKVGFDIRTNSESFVGITTFDKKKTFSDGIAISSIFKIDKRNSLEPVRYASGSGFWRLLMSPLVHGPNAIMRLIKSAVVLLSQPIQSLKVFLVWDWAKRTQILMFMSTLDSTLRFRRGLIGLKSTITRGKSPTPFVPNVKQMAERYAEIVKGKPVVLLTETLLGIPTTAHILGGAVMGKDIQNGVVDKDNKVFGYQNMYICDGSVISANPGVNPSLTILAIAERAMAKIPQNYTHNHHIVPK